MLKFHVGALLHKPQGAKERFDFNEPIQFKAADEPRLKAPVQGSVQFLKLPHEINVQITNLRAVAELHCSRCLESFDCAVEIPMVSREFIIDLPERDFEDGEEIYHVNKNTNEIELEDMVRAELLLHFPAIPLCSESCKGLCDQCGANLNKTTCSCTRLESRNTPFNIP